MNEQNGKGGIRLADLPRLEMCPDLKHMGEFDPDNLTAAEVLKVITLALAKTRGADVLMRMKAEVVMNEQFARGRGRGLKEGYERGYWNGYHDGLSDGKKEAVDTRAQEEAERATIKAAARARSS